MKKIAMLHYAAPPGIGGVELTIYHHARLCADGGYRVMVLAGDVTPFYDGVETLGIPLIGSRHERVLAVTEELSLGKVTDAFTSLRDEIYSELCTILADTDICIVHNALTLHKNLALTAALYELSQKSNFSILAWCHDFAWEDKLYINELHDGYPWNLLRIVWPGVRYIAVSEHRRERLARLSGMDISEIEVVMPGVDTMEFLRLKPLSRQLITGLNLLSAAPLILLPARITRRKNIEFAIGVMGKLLALMPRAILLVTGPPGPHNPSNAAYLTQLKDLRSTLGITGQVRFLYEQQDEMGMPLKISDAVMTDLYQVADVLLFPSREEGFGIPVLEAGLARLPVFASDIPPVRESGLEWVYRFDPDGSPEIVAAAIADYLEQDRSYQLRKRVLEQFTWQSVWEKKLKPMLENRSS